ncbi:HipA N-terminal domain-containing protein [Bradyrhizobium sp. 33ap4]|uniref:HipA N-terminal domain-containing protein n=1 Tax=Bradyrhizobium sp. 33ap4 TaxID=3061630 RepID=UPI00293113B6|nr:HipA N-terminal domain-containing protein [Bradyrhizobium sp. 33ap4]
MNVLMGGVPIGRLEQKDTGVLDIEYADRWLAADRVQIPLSMSLPLAAKKHSGAKVANYLWNLLPDNDRTLQKWGQIYGVSPNSAFALLSKVGEDYAGAIQIVTDEGMAANADSPGEHRRSGRLTSIDGARFLSTRSGLKSTRSHCCAARRPKCIACVSKLHVEGGIQSVLGDA